MNSIILIAIVVAVSANTVKTQSLPSFHHPRCPANELPCGIWGCYNPNKYSGQSCKNGRVVCNFGYRECNNKCIPVGTECNACILPEVKCGHNCFNPRHGETCTSAGNICRYWQRPCGKFCYSTALQKCFNNNLICKRNQEPCFGVSCYNPGEGQKCYKDGLICNTNEVPVDGKCCKISG